MWSILVSTENYLYTVGRYNTNYILGKIAKDAAPDNIEKQHNIAGYLYCNRYTRSTYLDRINDISRWMMDVPVIRTSKKFLCVSCDDQSILYTPLSCLHTICASCVSDMIHRNIPCVVCGDKTEKFEWSNKIFNGIPYAHLFRILQTIRLTDKHKITMINEFH